MSFFGIGMKTDLFQSYGHCWVFQICWHIECSPLIASFFRILNSPAGISVPPLALFLEMLPKAQLTSLSRMSSSRWMTIPSWLSGSLRSFLFSSSVYSCYLLVSAASVRSLLSLSFIVPIFTWNIPLISPIFLKRSLIFPIPLFYSVSLHVHWRRPSYLSLLFSGTLHSVGCIFPFLLSLSFLFFPQFSSVQSLSRVRLFATPWIAAC